MSVIGPSCTLMIAASWLTTTAASWPLLEPAVFKTMGIVKKKGASQELVNAWMG